MRESRNRGNLRKRSHLGEEERQRFLYQTALNNYVQKKTIQQHFEFNGYQRKKDRIFPRAQDEGDEIQLRINNEIQYNDCQEPTFCDAMKDLLTGCRKKEKKKKDFFIDPDENKKKTDDNFVDKIKDFFSKITWPSCCDCDEIKNDEETHEINNKEVKTIKTPLNARNKSSIS